MKKYTDTELLETLLPMLHYTLITNNFSDTVDFKIFETICRYVDKDFITALEDKISKLADEIPVKAEDNVADKNAGHNDNYKEEQKWN